MSNTTLYPASMSFDTLTKGLWIPATWNMTSHHVPSSVMKRTSCCPRFGMRVPSAAT